MEEQLAAYRARKAKEQSQLNTNKSSWFRSRSSPMEPNGEQDNLDDLNEPDRESALAPKKSSSSNSFIRLPECITNSRLGHFIQQDNSILTNTVFLRLILWFSLLIVFILIEFAAVYIVLSIFYIMYVNMRGSGDSKKTGELSAYSVFNPNCERIDGTFTAEQFEKELLHGLGST